MKIVCENYVLPLFSKFEEASAIVGLGAFGSFDAVPNIRFILEYVYFMIELKS